MLKECISRNLGDIMDNFWEISLLGTTGSKSACSMSNFTALEIVKTTNLLVHSAARCSASGWFLWSTSNEKDSNINKQTKTVQQPSNAQQQWHQADPRDWGHCTGNASWRKWYDNMKLGNLINAWIERRTALMWSAGDQFFCREDQKKTTS